MSDKNKIKPRRNEKKEREEGIYFKSGFTGSFRQTQCMYVYMQHAEFD